MKIVISEFCGLGNSVHLSAAFKSLKQDKEIEVSLVGDDRYSGLTANKFSKYLNNIVKFSIFNFHNLLKTIKLIKQSDYLIIPAFSNPTLFFLLVSILFSNNKFIISNRFFKNTHFVKKIIIKLFLLIKKTKITEVDHSDNLHEIDINQKFINSIDFNNLKKLKSEKINYFDHPGENTCLNKFNLKEKNYFVFQPICNNGGVVSWKNWPLQNFKELSEMLLSEYNYHEIVLVGDSGDKKLFSSFINHKRIKNLISKTNIPELITILKNSSFIICPDSSVLHLSDSMNLKNISLIGQSNLLKIKPNNLNSIIIKKEKTEQISPFEVMDILKKNM